MAKADKIDIKSTIGSKTQAVWNTVVTNMMESIKNQEKEIMINKAFLEKAREQMKKEKKKFWSK